MGAVAMVSYLGETEMVGVKVDAIGTFERLAH